MFYILVATKVLQNQWKKIQKVLLHCDNQVVVLISGRTRDRTLAAIAHNHTDYSIINTNLIILNNILIVQLRTFYPGGRLPHFMKDCTN